MKKLPSDVKLLSAKEKLIATSEKENWLQEVTLANQSCLNFTWWAAFENSKLSFDFRLQKYLELITLEKEVSHKASRDWHALRAPQHTGTPCVQRRLMALSARGKQFTADINDHITKQLVTFKNVIQLEKLTLYLRILPDFISKQIYNSRVQRTGNRAQCCHLYPVPYNLKRGKANVSQSKWSYAELDGFIHYQVVMNNSLVIRVDADYYSQSIPCCGYTNKHKCLNQGLTIRSRSRGFELCADLVGGQNVAITTLLLRQDGCHTGLIVIAYPPKSLFKGNNTIVSPFWGNSKGVCLRCETKTERLSSFLKPRWS